MSLFDRFRQPEWKHADPAVRVAAIRRLGPADHEVLLGIVKTEADASMRRVAVRKLSDPVVLAEVARGDQDEGVRETAAEILAGL
ncbi:MAG TPA: hypothetical protein VFM29_01890, partial [Vicinamibacteria bacterium]|nr:hypothetical protein [Vicinamibacteria bacterium]